MLWATVRHYEGVKDPDEAGKRVREGFVPLISAHEGFGPSFAEELEELAQEIETGDGTTSSN